MLLWVVATSISERSPQVNKNKYFRFLPLTGYNFFTSNLYFFCHRWQFSSYRLKRMNSIKK
ncbi:uncharacterized protein Dvar_41210 [Desulfosarcina variabilis str. Montpellier]